MKELWGRILDRIEYLYVTRVLSVPTKTYLRLLNMRIARSVRLYDAEYGDDRYCHIARVAMKEIEKVHREKEGKM